MAREVVYVANQSSADVSDFLAPFYPVVHAFALGQPITGVIDGCKGKCSATIRAPALAQRSCVSSYEEVNYTAPLRPHQEDVFELTYAAPISRTVIAVDFISGRNSTNGQEYFLVRTMLPDEDITNTCKGKLRTTDCFYGSCQLTLIC
jgi:hypothetical protein